MLLSSSRPFYSRNQDKVIAKIIRVDYNFDGPGWLNVSDPAKDFVNNLLVLDPKSRMNASRSLRHTWILKRRRIPHDETPSNTVLAHVDSQLVKYAHASGLKKLALNLIAHKTDAADVKELRKVFRAIDKDNDGVITFDEFKDFLQTKGYFDDECRNIFDSVVSPLCSARMSHRNISSEFASVPTPAQLIYPLAFIIQDANRSGKIDYTEVFTP